MIQKNETIDENWTVLVSYFPKNWEELGWTSGAIKYRLNKFNIESDFLRVLLIHIGLGYSLRETSVIAKLSGLADISDVAILKRLRKSEQWLLELCRELLIQNGVYSPKIGNGMKVRLVDWLNY